ncbi:acyl-CoA dehydrogenase, partial [Novosphingobium sp. 2637]|nr:acyl-CoA dehydrogenase [Novosphingobium mangrovi (ex Hu et al. 2023)]
MQVALNEDQRAIRDALDALTRPFEEAPVHEAPLVAASPDFARALTESGFLDVACDPDLGTATAGVVVERLARLPFAVEAATRAFFAPLLDDVSGPVCLVEGTRTPRLVRFLEPGACVIVVEEQGVSYFTAGEQQLRCESESLFAYPMASLLEIPEERAGLAITPGEARTRARAALAAE